MKRTKDEQSLPYKEKSPMDLLVLQISPWKLLERQQGHELDTSVPKPTAGYEGFFMVLYSLGKKEERKYILVMIWEILRSFTDYNRLGLNKFLLLYVFSEQVSNETKEPKYLQIVHQKHCISLPIAPERAEPMDGRLTVIPAIVCLLNIHTFLILSCAIT